VRITIDLTEADLVAAGLSAGDHVLRAAGEMEILATRITYRGKVLKNRMGPAVPAEDPIRIVSAEDLRAGQKMLSGSNPYSDRDYIGKVFPRYQQAFPPLCKRQKPSESCSTGARKTALKMCSSCHAATKAAGNQAHSKGAKS
jgi:hypothetical protein